MRPRDQNNRCAARCRRPGRGAASAGGRGGHERAPRLASMFAWEERARGVARAAHNVLQTAARESCVPPSAALRFPRPRPSPRGTLAAFGPSLNPAPRGRVPRLCVA